MSKFGTFKRIIGGVINETALLNRYLKSRGINPEFATKDQKVAHSKTTQFKTWAMHHINDNVVESVDRKDTITFDIPLLIRVLEFAREDLKNDVNLHKMVERLISMRGKGTLTMNQYGRIIKEEVESDRLDEISGELQHRYFKAAYAQKNDKTVPKDVRKKRSTGMNKVINRTLRRNRLDTPGAAQDFKDQEARRGVGHVRDHVEVEGKVVSEAGNKPLEPHVGMGDSHTPREMKTQMSGASTEFVKSTAAKKPGIFHSKVAHMQNKLAKSELRKRNEEVVAEGYYVHREKDTKLHFNTVAQLRQSKTPSHLKVTDHKHNHLGTVADVLRNQTLYKTEAKETNYGGDYQASVLAVKAKAEKKPVDMKSLAARMQASYRRDNEQNKQGKTVKESLRSILTGVPDKPKFKVGDKVHYNMQPAQKDGTGHGTITKVHSPEHYEVDGKKTVNHFELKHVKESLEPTAACNQPGDGANSPDDVAPKGKKLIQMSKAAKIKSIVKEDLYDKEKDDKPSAGFKAPKVQKPGINSETREQPQAAAILKGGKTLTGTPRDTIEIDPMLTQRKPQKNG